jgi:hypothetical protein
MVMYCATCINYWLGPLKFKMFFFCWPCVPSARILCLDSLYRVYNSLRDFGPLGNNNNNNNNNNRSIYFYMRILVSFRGYGIKVRSYWEPIGNLRNILRTTEHNFLQYKMGWA